ncbi:hypothetical protein RCL1_008439 [Eukaryota sp. TZLM3-RCL]
MYIYVVDDDNTTRATVASMCRQCKAKVATAENGLVAFNMLKKDETLPDLILSDYMMPELNGYELLKSVKSNSKLKEVPFVIMSTFDDPLMVVRCIEAGAQDYLLKPLVFATLKRRIDSIQKAASSIPIEKHKELQRRLSSLENQLNERDSEVTTLKRKVQLMTDTLKAFLTDIVFLPSFSSSALRAQEAMSQLLKISKEDESAVPEEGFDVFQLIFELGGTEIATPLVSELAGRRRSSVTAIEGSPRPEHIQTHNFDVFKFNNSQQVKLFISMLSSLGLVQHFDLDTSKLRSFVEDVARHYKYNPYHNFAHAIDVSQMCFFLLSSVRQRRLIEPVEQLALMTAALCHDVEHPGLNNAFLVQARSPLAIFYNDLSVLENHHASRASMILIKEQNNFVSHLSPTLWNRFRSVMVSCILSTDMAQHSKFLQNIAQLKEDCSISNECDETVDEVLRSSPLQRLTLCQALLKICDIGNPTRPFRIARKWAELLIQEFLGQSETEKVHGLQSIIFPSGVTEDVYSNLSGLQIGFMESVVKPLLQSTRPIIGATLDLLLNEVESNKKNWQEIG